MTPGATRGLLGLGLVVTLLAAYFAPTPTDDGVALAPRTRGAAGPPAAASGGNDSGRSVTARNVDVLSIRPRGAEDEADAGDDVFGSARWTPLPETPSVQREAVAQVDVRAESQAPPLPFRVLGRYVEDGRVAVFLQHNDRDLVVRVGDTVAEHYKVESLEGGTLTLLYTPLNQKQTLDVGDSESKDAR